MRHPFATVVAFMLLIAIVVISIYNNKSWFMKDEHVTNQGKISTSSTNEALVPVLIPKTKSVLNVGTTSNKKKEEPVQLERKTILLGCVALALIPIAILGFKLVGHAAKPATPTRHIRSTFTRLIGSQQIFTVLSVFMIFLLLISIPVFKFRHPGGSSRQDPSVKTDTSSPEERLPQRMYSILRQYNNTHYKELCDRVDELVNDGTIVKTQKKNLLKLLQILHERILFVVSTIDAITKLSTRSGSLDNDLLGKIRVLGICDRPDLAYLYWNKFGLSESVYTALFGDNIFHQALLIILSYQELLLYTFSDHDFNYSQPVFDKELSLLLYNRSLDSLLIHKEHLRDPNGNHVNVTEFETDLALVRQVSLNIFTSGLNTSVSTILAQQKTPRT